ncbi:MAG: DUF1727 domain-containing protein [Clostridia bacterium]|nr:DUF1727 domain-containing protein [Clostridia bacterium]
MKFRRSTALIIAKILVKILRITGRGGTSLPGKLALLIYPALLSDLAFNTEAIIVTGTNGKTTTSRMISEILKNAGLSFFENKSGANLISGITTSFIENHHLNCQYAVIECDEAAFKTVSKHLNAKYILVTNLFRDQLDRYGEITHTLNNILEGIKNCKEATVSLNADCSLSSSLKDSISNHVIFYGVDIPLENTDETLSDAPYCIKCKSRYHYSFRTYGHLGGFYCPSCGYKRTQPDVSVIDILSVGKCDSKIVVSMNNTTYQAVVNLPGEYNIYNALAALSVGIAMSVNEQSMIDSLSTFTGGFGRMENIILNHVDTHIILVKNPAGLNGVIRYLSNLNDEMILTIVLNDKFADGTDVSWIWDADFENLIRIMDRIKMIYVAGIRYDDMALRLKYAGIDQSKIFKVNNYNQLIDEISDDKYKNTASYVLPTYTAMFDLRLKLTKKFKLKNFWK